MLRLVSALALVVVLGFPLESCSVSQTVGRPGPGLSGFTKGEESRDGHPRIVATGNSPQTKGNNIYSMRPDGTGVRKLTREEGGGEGGPLWSPDRSEISFSRGVGTYETEIYFMDADGSNQVRITNNSVADGVTSWVMHKSRVVFVRAFRGGRIGPNSEVMTMQLDGTKVRRLTHNRYQDGQGQWKPGGRTILFVSDRDREQEFDTDLYLMRADGSHVRKLTSTRQHEYSPDWSPDGRLIVFARRTSRGAGDIFVMRADGSRVRRLTRTAADEGSAKWSPNGRMIAFVQGGVRIYKMRSDGSRVTRVSKGDTEYSSIDW